MTRLQEILKNNDFENLQQALQEQAEKEVVTENNDIADRKFINASREADISKMSITAKNSYKAFQKEAVFEERFLDHPEYFAFALREQTENNKPLQESWEMFSSPSLTSVLMKHYHVFHAGYIHDPYYPVLPDSSLILDLKAFAPNSPTSFINKCRDLITDVKIFTEIDAAAYFSATERKLIYSFFETRQAASSVNDGLALTNSYTDALLSKIRENGRIVNVQDYTLEELQEIGYLQYFEDYKYHHGRAQEKRNATYGIVTTTKVNRKKPYPQWFDHIYELDTRALKKEPKQALNEYRSSFSTFYSYIDDTASQIFKDLIWENTLYDGRWIGNSSLPKKHAELYHYYLEAFEDSCENGFVSHLWPGHSVFQLNKDNSGDS